MSSPAVSSSSSQILSAEEWCALYPAKEYSTKSDRVKKFILHFLLALGQEASTLAQIEVLKSKKSEKIFIADESVHGLTPLMIATMRGQIKVVKAIAECLSSKERKGLINSVDQFGWSAVHHAVISSREIYEYLVSFGANIHAKTYADGTPENLRQLMGDLVSNYSQGKVSIQLPNGKIVKITEISALKFEELTGLKYYRDEPQYPSRSYKLLWQQETLPPSTSSMLLEKLYLKFRDNPPALLIKPSKDLQGKDIHSFDLQAAEDIPDDAIICEYSGIATNNRKIRGLASELTAEAVQSIEYYAPPYDARERGNGARFANCGWPNAGLVGISGFKGAQRNVLIAFDPIPKNSSIFWDYGIKQIYLTFGKQVLFGKEKMRQHYAQGLSFRMEEYRLRPVTSLQSKLLFPINSPAAMLDLHFTGLVHIKEWYRVLKKQQAINIYTEWLEASQHLGAVVVSFQLRVIEFDFIISQRQESKKVISEWVLKNIGDLSIMQLLKGFKLIQETLKSGSQLQSNPVAYFTQLNDQLKDYDWKKDVDAPLGVKKRCIDLVATYSTYDPRVLQESVLPDLKIYCETNPEDTDNYIISKYILDHFEKS